MSRAASVLVLGFGVAACGQFEGLRANKHFKDGNQLYAQQDYRKAAAEYEEAIKADPACCGDVPYSAHFYLANSYDNLYKPARKGEEVNDSYLQDALKNYQIAAEKITDPKLRKLSLQYLAAIYASDKLNEPEKAEPVVKQIIAMDPNDSANYFGLAKIYEDAGKFEEAEAVLKQAQEASPNSVEVWSQLGNFYNRRGDFDKAMEAFTQITRLEPENPQNYYQLAVYYEEKVRKDYTIKPAQKVDYLKRGMEAIDKALEIRPDYFEALTYKNLLLRQQALVEKNPARQKQLIEEADRLRDKAIEVQNLKSKGVVASD
ncbi:MAG TPA: tetratricopeptide repeat protein [Vicinamibacterales bacterium]